VPLIVGVAFKPITKIYYFDPAGVEDLQPDEHVIVETARGRTLGKIVIAPRVVPDSEISGALKPVVRRTTAWDMVQSDQMAHKEDEARTICQKRADALGLKMKVAKTEYNYDGGSVVVYFTADQRVDFRKLVQDLAQTLRTRVEMRQVGVRDEAKFIGGFGRCGRELCCASWLREFQPVSIKMAKQQDLPLNNSEISGSCGRLLCCLSYENDFYTEARKHMPRMNSTLITPEGSGKVRQIHVLRNSVTVKVVGENNTTEFVEVSLTEDGTPVPATPVSPEPETKTPSPQEKPPSRRRHRKPRSAKAAKTGKPHKAEGKKETPSSSAEETSTRPGRSRRSRPRRRRRPPQS
jgi:cell fate regulator YaaT (PSP1 superfamily)